MQRHRGNGGERDGRQGRERDGEMSRIRSEKRGEGEAENERRIGKERGGKEGDILRFRLFRAAAMRELPTRCLKLKQGRQGKGLYTERGLRARVCVCAPEREREREGGKEREKKIGKDGGEREGDAHGPA